MQTLLKNIIDPDQIVTIFSRKVRIAAGLSGVAALAGTWPVVGQAATIARIALLFIEFDLQQRRWPMGSPLYRRARRGCVREAALGRDG
jgi:hypothetical protein